jgi:hypothetical protein
LKRTRAHRYSEWAKVALVQRVFGMRHIYYERLLQNAAFVESGRKDDFTRGQIKTMHRRI